MYVMIENGEVLEVLEVLSGSYFLKSTWNKSIIPGPTFLIF